MFREVADGEGTKGQLGVTLTALASLAVDPAFIPLGLPLWLDTTWPLEQGKPMPMLVVAQAARNAGHMAQRGRYFLLLPKTN